MTRFSSYSFGEARTGIGQLVHFSLPSKNRERSARIIKAVLRRLVRHIDIYATKPVTNVTHGGYGRYTRYNMTQHQYAGSRGGYIEILEIQDAPDDRWPFVIYEYRPERESHFSEWETLALAEKAWNKYIQDPYKTKLQEMEGCKRLVRCGPLTPWFYAVGEQSLVGDYAFPEGLQDDPVFVVGKRFVVTDYQGQVSIKTCMGCRFFDYMEDRYSGMWSRDKKRVIKRVVYWDDGSTWSDLPGNKSEREPRLLRDDELWVTEAWEQFQAMLSGEVTEFSIPFIGGRKFTGKISSDKTTAHQAEGEYLATVTVSGRSEPLAGSFSFTPTLEIPDAVTYIQKGLKLKPGERIERIEIKDCQPPNLPKGQKKRRWSGVFFRGP
ncbi:MAG: hypothetical protein KIH67_004660 [Candidatus Moranbacteria bacterium]|nr:hypothetical protein [Candidatus Moranbacteria bacterium]